MDGGDLPSGSGSDIKKKQKLDDSVDDEDDSSSPMEVERRRYRSMAKVAIGYGVNPSVQNSFIAESIHSVCPEFSLDTSKLKSAVLEMHEEGKEKVKKMLKEREGSLTLCYEWFVLGDWTSDAIDGPILNEDFIGISAYFADENWKMNKWVLWYHPRASLRVKDIYVDSIKNVILDYGIESKVSTLLMPNYSDLGVKAFDDFRRWIEESGKSEIHPRVFLIYCCSDIFRLMVDDVFKDISIWFMDRVRMMFRWGRLAPKNWDVTLCNLQKAVYLFEEDEDYEDWEQPTDEEWITIKTFCKLAGCIYKVAKELFDGEYPTSNVYFHLLAELKFMLKEELKNGDSDYFLSKAKVILERFVKYWNDMFLVLATASVLDPRFKTKYLEFYCSKKEVNEEGSKAETVLDYIRNLYAAGDISPLPECPDASVKPKSLSLLQFLFGVEAEGDEEEEEDEKEEEKKPNGYKDFVLFQEFLKFEGSSREFQESELDSYLKEPIMEWKKEFNALDWWREKNSKYPILSRVARDILSIPISRGTSHRAYVADKRECPEFIVSMEDKLVNAMMCSESWPRF
ncbi:PREDICTED: zinc finger BED domain-containing protein RICESLEEPER 2-like [Camelina sativa]|uniref:Zinc finger BED domain-containing protein RICESLEEPER 2-like n=1 Tax=Camelina sativa TaxID=90675 RepID=A0ABM0W501_CAMSA|nr:PREDICTED: zinc finger BED domain-containing protein RICESLEEPER 2-like [Camelina sativa]